MAKGRSPQAGLDPRNCTVCGKRFQPYRANNWTCSRECYKQTDTYKNAHAQQNERRKVPKERARRLAQRKARPQHAAQQKAYTQSAFLKRYGLTPEEFGAKLEAQNGRCALCGSAPDPDGKRSASRLHQDHDHLTGQNRDLLCGRCNVGIGMFSDDPALLRAAAEYIERHRQA
jgi:hypothetical protein